MVDDLAGKTIGDRIRSLRGKLLTQRQLADAAQVSIELIRKLEQGQRHTASISSLQRIARALDVDIAELVGKPSALPSTGPDAGVMAIRRALTTVDDLLGETTCEGEPPTPTEAQRLVNYAWGAYWAGRYELLGAMLPSALAQLRAGVHAAAANAPAQAHELLGRGYWVTACTLVHLGQQDSAFLAIRQALDAAERGDDALLTATLRGSVSWQLLVAGRYDEAVKVALRSALAIEPTGDVSLENLSAYGSLLLLAATAAGRDRRAEYAQDLLAESKAVAGRVGHDRNDYESPFGPSQVVMQTVDVGVVTEDFTGALNAARAMPRDAGLPLAARARHLADLALAHVRLGHYAQALDALLTAERMAADWIRYQTLPRQVVAELIQRERRVHAPLRGLARRLGVTGS